MENNFSSPKHIEMKYYLVGCAIHEVASTNRSPLRTSPRASLFSLTFSAVDTVD